MSNTDLPTVRATLEDVLRSCLTADSEAIHEFDFDPGGAADAILAKLSDPAVQDELARWLVAQEDGPFNQMFPNGQLEYFRRCYVLRQRTRSEPT